MKQIPSRDFQKMYAKLTEAHEVTAWGEVIGFYYPKGTEPVKEVRSETPQGTRLVRTEREVPDPVKAAKVGGRERDSWLTRRRGEGSG